MKDILNFLIETEKLKKKKRRGWVIHKIKNPETTAEHIFHLAFFVWILGSRKKINLGRAIEMALVHDICEVYSRDFTSYDAVAIKGSKELTSENALRIKPQTGRPTLWQRKKLEKIKRKLEIKAMERLTSKLPSGLKKRINNLWNDYENGLTKEGRFVKQADRLINFFQGLEYWKKYGKIEYRLWVRRAKEVIDDPFLIQFLKVTEEKFCKL